VSRVELKWHGERVKAGNHRGAVKGLKKACLFLLGESNALVPLEEGPLQNSGTYDVDDTELEGAVGYDTAYAVRQHEELTWRHDPGRQAKYLEEPFVEHQDTLLALIAAEIRKANEGRP
jgi:hypothetical protein